MVLENFDRDTTKLVPDELDLLTSRELSQYFIETFDLTYYVQGRKFIKCHFK